MTHAPNAFASSLRYAAQGPRWTARLRLSVLTDIAEGKTTKAAACASYGLTEGEIDGWQAALDNCSSFTTPRQALTAGRLRHVAKIARIQGKIDELCGAI